MSRSGYADDCYDILQYGRWRAQVMSSIRGKRGQAFLRDLLMALNEMPDKRLIADKFRLDGEVCALGALGAKRGLDLESLDLEDHEVLAEKFGITHQLIQEIEYENDSKWNASTPELRWEKMHKWVNKHIKKETSS